jgi:8-oxo-dGTP pyrophosphatase MutT (NUDIX family)
MENTVWQGKFIKVTLEDIEGQTFERAYIPDGVVIFPVDDHGRILVIREKRPHETPSVRLKPVTGMLDEGEIPLENAQRELQEEIGFKAADLHEFWTLRSSGTVNSTTHFFLAKGLTPSKLPNPDGEDVIEEILALSLDDLRHRINSEEMRWGVSVMGFLRLEMLVAQGRFSLAPR